MFLGEEFEEFSKALRGKSVQAIRSMAKERKLELPNIQAKELLIESFYAAEKGLPPPYAVDPKKDAVPPAAAPADTLPAAVAADAGETALSAKDEAQPAKRIIRCRRPSYYRCGRHWDGTRRVVEIGEFTPEQWKTLCADANLIIRDEK